MLLSHIDLSEFLANTLSYHKAARWRRERGESGGRPDQGELKKTYEEYNER